MLHIDATTPLVKQGTPDVIYDKIYIRSLQIDTVFSERVSAMVNFRYYRVTDDGIEESPLELGTFNLLINDLNQVLDQVEGGANLKDGVESAFIALGKAYGII